MKPNYPEMMANVHIVSDMLKEENLGHIPFFIAGGSIFSLMNGSEYSDIDVYFYNKESLNTVIEHFDCRADYSSENALSFSSKEHFQKITGDFKAVEVQRDRPTQFIKKVYGEVLEVFKTFDLNCCKCAYTSNFELIKSRDFSNEIVISDGVFNFETLSRIIKYRNKGGNNFNEAFKEGIDYIFNNMEKELSYGYGDQQTRTAWMAIRQTFFSEFLNGDNVNQMIHDGIFLNTNSANRLETFEKITRDMYFYNEKFNHYTFQHMCNEYILMLVLKSDESSVYKEEYADTVKGIYPEYFI